MVLGSLRQEVAQFLKQHSQLKKPLLLGFSGGADSLSLAHILLSLNHPFHVAHFDHGWREESKEECKQLENWAKSHKIPFYSESSPSPDLSENGARRERVAFFEKLFASEEYEALVLAHHRGDHVETILKRLLEGAHLINCKGIEPRSVRESMPIWRPLLTISKSKILKFVDEQGLNPIEDKSNFDPKYLRARMRGTIIPLLSKEFGKEVESPLVSIGNQAKSLQAYLDKKTSSYSPVVGPFGKMWDFSCAHPVEIEHVLSKQFSCSRNIIEKLIRAVESSEANFHVHFGEHKLIVDRQKVFWIERPLPKFCENIPLGAKTIYQEEWQWEIQTGGSLTHEEPWLSFWKGKISLALPKGEYHLAPASPYYRKKWQNGKVPAFMRDCLPIILKNGKPVAEFLLGTKNEDPSFCVAIAIKNKNLLQLNEA
ncbi:MAG: tRNA lysidine(34) synthetase TilS [Simkaniaceae bacterium]|nr:tRNA lysidine(34) synthetase TilS [Candidatus Sacchlamyda saccharinae]